MKSFPLLVIIAFSVIGVTFGIFGAPTVAPTNIPATKGYLQGIITMEMIALEL